MAEVLFERPRILDRVPRDRHTVIEASAGTGKTYTIEHLFIDLLLTQDCSIEHILVLTYTERAAGELRSRIRAMIERILSAAPSAQTSGKSFWRIDDAARLKLKRSLFSFDKAPIHTIHGFFQRVITENAFSSCRLFAQTLVDSRTAFSEAFMASLRSDFGRDPALSPYLSCWLGHKGSNVEELEGFLYDCHSRKREIRPDFKPAAVSLILDSLFLLLQDGSMSTRIRQVCEGSRPKKVPGVTTKALINKCDHLALLTQAYHADRNLAMALSECRRDYLSYLSEKLGSLSPMTEEVQGLLTAVTNLIGSAVPFEAAVVQLFLPRVRARLASDKKRRGLYDFDDMIGYLLEGLDGPQGAALLSALRMRYRYALIDESQDTDDSQWTVFRKIFYESGQANILYLIGDPKQAIYGFRGADVHTYLAARDVICGTDKPVRLNENYRSAQRLIAAYNEIFLQATESPFFDGSITYDSPVECGRKDLRAVGPDGREIVPVVLLGVESEGTTVRSEDYTRNLGAWIAREIRRLLSPGAPMIRFGDGCDLRPLRPHDVFILTRKEQEGRDVSEFLREEGVPSAFYRQEGLFQTREAEHIRDLLLAIERPLDNSRRFKAWLTPFFSVPIERLLACRDLPETEPLARKLLLWHDIARRRDFRELFSGILSESGLITRELFLKDSEREITNYLHIFEILLEEAAASRCELTELNRRLQGFIGETGTPLREDANIQRLETEKEAVQIMTMHKSKGLEAAVVFIFGGYAQGRPERFALYHEKGMRVLHVGPDENEKAKAVLETLQEDQRLLYVAVTRAKVRLYLPFVPPERLTGPAKRGTYAQLNARLADMISAPHFSSLRDLFLHETTGRAGFPQVTDDGQTGQAVRSWQPEPTLRDRGDDSEHFSALRQRHRGFEVTSYTRMKQSQRGLANLSEAGDADLAETDHSTGAQPGESVPGGTEYGSALHRIIEKVPLTSLRTVRSPEEWQQSEEITGLVNAWLLYHGIDTRHSGYSARLVYNALTARVVLDEEVLLPGFSSLENYSREVEFLYPYPEQGHHRLDEVPARGFQIDRGYVKGTVDFLFEHGGRTYLVDWKTDILADYDEASLRRHFETGYALQSKLYIIALVKMLNAHGSEAYDKLFGGMLYCFVRVMESPGDGRRGILLSRPSWQEMLRFERDLRESDEYSGVPR